MSDFKNDIELINSENVSSTYNAVPDDSGDLCDSDAENTDYDTVTDLVDGINLDELSTGTTFQIKTDRNEPREESTAYFGDEEMLKYVKFDCINSDSDEEGGRPGAPGGTPFERIAAKMKNITPDGSVKKKVVTIGDKNGQKVPKGALVTIHYRAYFEYGEEPFDSTNLRGGPQKYRLGSGSLLIGLEIGVETMYRKEVAQFLVEPQLAWGKLGCPPRIPPNATALFEVHLIDFIDSGGAANFDALTPEEQKNVDFPVALQAAKGLNLQGKDLFKNRNFGQASKRYKRAVFILETCTSVRNEEDEREQNNLLLNLYVNLTITFNLLNQPAPACTYSKKALALDPNHAKALYNRGKALLVLNDFKEASRCLRAAKRLDSKNEDINRQLKKLEEKYAADKTREQLMCQRMFSSDSKWQSNNLKKREKKIVEAVSEKFRETVINDLKEFKNGDQRDQFNIPSGLTAAEEEFIRQEANSLGLKIISNSGKITITK